MAKLILRFLSLGKHDLSKSKKRFHSRLSAHSGQMVVTFSLILVLILIFVFAIACGFNLIQDRRHLMTVCREGTLKTENQVAPLIKELLELNPLAIALRLQIIELEAAIAIAIASENFAAASEYERQLHEVREQQDQLAETQKRLIQTANIELQTGTLQTYSRLQSEMNELQNREARWTKPRFILGKAKIPTLAVKADDRNKAPTYSAKKDFEKLQASEISWSQQYSLSRRFIFDFEHKSFSQCSATLEEKTWIAKLRRDKRF